MSANQWGKRINNVCTQKQKIHFKKAHPLGLPPPSLFKQIAIFPIAFLPLLDKELSRSRHKMTSSGSAQHTNQKNKTLGCSFETTLKLTQV